MYMYYTYYYTYYTHLFLLALVLPGPLRVKDEVASVEAPLLALPLELAHVVRRHPRLKLLSVVETRLYQRIRQTRSPTRIQKQIVKK